MKPVRDGIVTLCLRDTLSLCKLESYSIKPSLSKLPKCMKSYQIKTQHEVSDRRRVAVSVKLAWNSIKIRGLFLQSISGLSARLTAKD